MSAAPLRLAVLASGRGSNLAALIAARDAGQLPVQIALVASDKPACTALGVARAAGIPALALRPADFPDRASFDRALFAALGEAGIELVVMAGYMRIIDGAALSDWVGRMINIHPSLLPKYPGLHTHRRALAAGDAEHGASVHFVTAELDGGPVVAQVRLPVGAQDDEASLASRLLPLEHQLLPAVVRAMAEGQLRLAADGLPYWQGRALRQPLQWREDGWQELPI